MASIYTERLLQAIDSIQMSSTDARNDFAFEKKCGMACGIIAGWRKKGRDASLEAMWRIVSAFPQINSEYILKGVGGIMLEEEESKPEQVESNDGNVKILFEQLEHYKEMNKMLCEANHQLTMALSNNG